MIYKTSIKSFLVLALTSSVFADGKADFDLGKSWVDIPSQDLGMSFVEVPHPVDPSYNRQGLQDDLTRGYNPRQYNRMVEQQQQWMAANPEDKIGINGVVTAYVPIDQGDGFVIKRPVSTNQADLIKEAVLAADKAYDLYKGGAAGAIAQGYELYKSGAALHGNKVFFEYGGIPECFVTCTPVLNGKPLITVAFRGSKEIWLDHVQTNARPGGGDNFYSHGIVKGTVHSAMNQRYNAVREGLIETISRFLQEQGITADQAEFLIAGHSLGAGLATIAACDLKQRVAINAKLNLATFNGPRIFNPTAAAAAEGILGKDHMLRMTRDGDPISDTGPEWMGYQHAGTSIRLEAKNKAYGLDNHKIAHNVGDATGQQAVQPINRVKPLDADFLKKQEQIQARQVPQKMQPSVMSRLFGWTGLVN